MRIPRRAYWVFLSALPVMAFAVGQVWDFAMALRTGSVGAAQLALGAMSIPLLAVSMAVVLRVLYVASGSGAANPEGMPQGKEES